MKPRDPDVRSGHTRMLVEHTGSRVGALAHSVRCNSGSPASPAMECSRSRSPCSSWDSGSRGLITGRCSSRSSRRRDTPTVASADQRLAMRGSRRWNSGCAMNARNVPSRIPTPIGNTNQISTMVAITAAPAERGVFLAFELQLGVERSVVGHDRLYRRHYVRCNRGMRRGDGAPIPRMEFSYFARSPSHHVRRGCATRR